MQTVDQAAQNLAALRAQVATAEQAVKDARRAEQEAKRAKAAQERADHQAAMYADHAEPFGLPASIGEAIYALAWDHGHASGYGEVEQHYGDFAELARIAFEAGIKS